jgi:hypothetical protein
MVVAAAAVGLSATLMGLQLEELSGTPLARGNTGHTTGGISHPHLNRKTLHHWRSKSSTM